MLQLIEAQKQVEILKGNNASPEGTLRLEDSKEQMLQASMRRINAI